MDLNKTHEFSDWEACHNNFVSHLLTSTFLHIWYNVMCIRLYMNNYMLFNLIKPNLQYTV